MKDGGGRRVRSKAQGLGALRMRAMSRELKISLKNKGAVKDSTGQNLIEEDVWADKNIISYINYENDMPYKVNRHLKITAYL